MIFSHVKISSFRVKAYLVFHWCLYNKHVYYIEIKAFTLKITFDALPAQPKHKWSRSGYKELKLTTKLFTCTYSTLCSLLIQKQITLGMHRKQNFQIPIHVVFGFKSGKAVSTFSFSLLLPSSFTFLAKFFSFARHLQCSRFHFGEESFRESFQDIRIKWKERYM